MYIYIYLKKGKKGNLVKIMKDPCKKPTRMPHYIIQPEYERPAGEGKNPNFPALRAVGCKSPTLKKKKEKLSGRDYEKISVKGLRKRLLM